MQRGCWRAAWDVLARGLLMLQESQLPSMEAALADLCAGAADVTKLGEGTYGEVCTAP